MRDGFGRDVVFVTFHFSLVSDWHGSLCPSTAIGSGVLLNGGPYKMSERSDVHIQLAYKLENKHDQVKLYIQTQINKKCCICTALHNTMVEKQQGKHYDNVVSISYSVWTFFR